MGVATGLKVGGSNFFSTPPILQGPPTFLGGHSKMWGGPEKFSSTVVYNGVVHYCGVWISHTLHNEENSLLCSVDICIIGIHNKEIDLCLVDFPTNI